MADPTFRVPLQEMTVVSLVAEPEPGTTLRAAWQVESHRAHAAVDLEEGDHIVLASTPRAVAVLVRHWRSSGFILRIERAVYRRSA